MSNDPNQYYTPYEKGYTAGLGMAQSDPATWQELEAMLNNPNIDKDFHKGLVAGREEAMHQLSAKEKETRKEAVDEPPLKQWTSKKNKDDFDFDRD